MEVNEKFCVMTQEDELMVDGGIAPAALYALGFAMNMSPLGALCVCGAVVVGGIVVAVKCS